MDMQVFDRRVCEEPVEQSARIGLNHVGIQHHPAAVISAHGQQSALKYRRKVAHGVERRSRILSNEDRS
jgi:hypothetical protein